MQTRNTYIHTYNITSGKKCHCLGIKQSCVVKTQVDVGTYRDACNSRRGRGPAYVAASSAAGPASLQAPLISLPAPVCPMDVLGRDAGCEHALAHACSRLARPATLPRRHAERFGGARVPRRACARQPTAPLTQAPCAASTYGSPAAFAAGRQAAPRPAGCLRVLA